MDKTGQKPQMPADRIQNLAALAQEWKGAETQAPVQPPLDKHLDYVLGLEFALQDLYQVIPGSDCLTTEQRYRLLLIVPALAVLADNRQETGRAALIQLLCHIVSLEGQLQRVEGELWWHIHTSHSSQTKPTATGL